MSIKISASALSAWLDCHRKYYLKFVEGVEEERPKHVIDGINAHYAIERGSNLEEIFDTLLSKGFTEEEARSISSIAWENIKDADFIEKEVRIEAKYSDNIYLKGVIDVIVRNDGILGAIDWKLSKSNPTMSKYKLQASFYYLLIGKAFVDYPKYIKFVNIKNGSYYTFTESLLEYYANMLESDIIPLFIQNRLSNSRTGMFLGKCRFCSVKRYCHERDDEIYRSIVHMF